MNKAMLTAVAVAILGGMPAVYGASVGLMPGVAYTQDFDSLSAVASTDHSIALAGWALLEDGSSSRNNEQYQANNGSSNAGDIYSYGSTGTSDRALGTLRSGTLIPMFGVEFHNAGAVAVESIQVAFTGEQWRLGVAGRQDQLVFQYSLDATALANGTWTSVAALEFGTPFTSAPTGANDGNTAQYRTALSATIGGLSIAPGQVFWMRWTDSDPSGSDDGLAIDDLSVKTAVPAVVPLPSAAAGGAVLLAGLVLRGRRRR